MNLIVERMTCMMEMMRNLRRKRMVSRIIHL